MILGGNSESPRGIKIIENNNRYLLVNDRIRYGDLDIKDCGEKGIIFSFFKI